MTITIITSLLLAIFQIRSSCLQQNDLGLKQRELISEVDPLEQLGDQPLLLLEVLQQK